MNTRDIELPPLPKPAMNEGDTALYAAFAGSQLTDYARAAIEPYAQRIAELESQAMPYAGVTVWVGNKRCSHGVTKDELELSTFDILQAVFDHARRVEGEGQ